MEELRLGVIESQFAEIIWSNEPLPSGELVKLCEQKLGWKKSNTTLPRVKNLWRKTLEVPFRRFLPRSQREKN